MTKEVSSMEYVKETLKFLALLAAATSAATIVLLYGGT